MHGTTTPTARDLVTRRVARQARRFPDLDLRPLDTTGLDRRDAALAFAIDQAVARRWLTLVTVLKNQISRPWAQVEPTVQAALLVGAAQLLLLERLPDYAVIHAAVEWLKTHPASGKAAGLANAVLRRLADLRECRADLGDRAAGELCPWSAEELPLADGRVWRLRGPVFDRDPRRRLAEQTSHPNELLARWARRLGADRVGPLAAHSLVHPPIIVTLSASLCAEGEGASSLPPSCDPHDEGGFAVFGGDQTALTALVASPPRARVQDPASARPVAATATLRPDLVIEVCAGRGTKTRQLAEIHPQARIIATDINPSKLAALRDAVAGHDRVQVIEHDHLEQFAGRGALVVTDVPCTNTAVLARRVEAKYRFNQRNLGKLVALQRRIVTGAVGLLAARGHLLYSTCSLEAEENERQTEWVVERYGLRICGSGTSMPTGGPGDPLTRYTDGGYFALLQQTAGSR